MAFADIQPSNENMWRSVILFGRNVASYKFALAQSLLDLANQEKTFLTLDELAVPFARHIAAHLKNVDKQATSSTSKCLEGVRRFNRGEIDESQLVKETVQRGFVNVIDAFHVVGSESIPVKFFHDERKQRGGIVLTDEILVLKQSIQRENLPLETEARWRLVEAAWELGIAPALLSVHYDGANKSFFAVDSKQRRIDVTSSRDALNGYQKGKCFYCFRDISIDPRLADLADVGSFHSAHVVDARSRAEVESERCVEFSTGMPLL